MQYSSKKKVRERKEIKNNTAVSNCDYGNYAKKRKTVTLFYTGQSVYATKNYKENNWLIKADWEWDTSLAYS